MCVQYFHFLISEGPALFMGVLVYMVASARHTHDCTEHHHINDCTCWAFVHNGNAYIQRKRVKSCMLSAH